MRCDVRCAQAYDGHMNLILSEVEETIMLVDVDDGAPPSAQSRINVCFFPFFLLRTRASSETPI